MTRKQAVDFLLNNPVGYAKMLGFDKLGSLHNEWIKEMVRGKDDYTLQASRGTYKTTCVSVALALIIVLLPNRRTMFMRKTDADIKEVIKQVQKILSDPHTIYFVQCIYGIQLKLINASASEISTNLTTDIRGTHQLTGIGTGGSITGKHFDFIFTDDIVNINDRVSKAERDRTKIVYQELQNVKNRGGKIFNSGTPWHVEDAFTLMPEAHKFNCYDERIKLIISESELAKIKERMIPSLFAANYELRHIASENVVFQMPQIGAGKEFIRNGTAHVDSAFYGEDFTAFSIMAKHNGKYYLYGRIWRKHVEDCYNDILKEYHENQCGKLYNEINADKGLVARDLKALGIRTATYNEGMNKHIKIVTFLKAIWVDVIIVDGTDDEYLQQIIDYTEDAEHDDAPDSAACLARLFYKPVRSNNNDVPNLLSLYA